jgi:hypothetical protein
MYAGASVQHAVRNVQRIKIHALMNFLNFVASPVAIRILDASSHRKAFAERVDFRSNLFAKYKEQATQAGISDDDQVYIPLRLCS